ncbi:MAG: HAMP domain-containing histidine kinase [Clostridia bacterium]|nr:HAMP domain-containing histidine kinase [Clostridia bacterium]
MDKLHLRPYTLRGRLMIALYAGAIVSCIIALLFAYGVAHLTVRNELMLEQQAVAVYLLEMEQRTDLAQEDIFYIAQQSNIILSVVSLDDPAVPEEVHVGLQSRNIHTQNSDLIDMPVTYVQMKDHLVRIDISSGVSVYFVAFFRVITTALSYLAVVVLMITLVSFRFSKPFQKMTAANARVREGDFDVRLPEDVPGEIGDMMRSFNAMTESLGNTAYLQKDFISSISHEFKTPIASIRGFAKLLQMPGLTEEQRQEYITLIAQESDRLSRLSETLLRLTALEQQTAPASISRFSLTEQIRQVILRMEPAWSTRSISWQLNLDEEVHIDSDEALLSHVWINLLQNALKFSPDGSCISVNVRHHHSQAVVSISDQGCGMDEETIKRIFDRFYQADRSRRQEGVGLGLCLVRRILDMLGGHIRVASTPGEGSTFTVTLPLSAPRPKPKPEEQLHA